MAVIKIENPGTEIPRLYIVSNELLIAHYSLLIN